jgi:hypothetical protein
MTMFLGLFRPLIFLSSPFGRKEQVNAAAKVKGPDLSFHAEKTDRTPEPGRIIRRFVGGCSSEKGRKRREMGLSCWSLGDTQQTCGSRLRLRFW